jgi:predicted ATPase
MLQDRSSRNALALWEGWARYYRGVLLIRRGELSDGLGLLRAGSSVLGGARFAVRFVTFLGTAASALGRAGQIDAGLAEVDEAPGQFHHSEEKWLIADLLRSRGEILLLQGARGVVDSAEKLFREALDLARRQDTLSWELRAATSLARLLRDQGRSAEALALLQPIYDRFTEGFDTADLKAAKALLDAPR